MKYRVQFQVETPPSTAIQKSLLPALPDTGSMVMLASGLIGFVQSINLYIDANGEARYVITLTPLDTPLSTS